MIKFLNSRQLTLPAIIYMALTVTGLSAKQALDITTPPSKAEWQHFNKMNRAQLQKLWQFQVARGHNQLSHWAWQWRLGWIKQCTHQSLDAICSNILKEGLKDDAMVVRAEAATALGVIYGGTANQLITNDLATAFLDPRNVRRGSPLFVCDRILLAISKIGGDHAKRLASKLANQYPATAAYWAKVQGPSPESKSRN
jgi:hypothetical protein